MFGHPPSKLGLIVYLLDSPAALLLLLSQMDTGRQRKVDLAKEKFFRADLRQNKNPLVDLVLEEKNLVEGWFCVNSY